jgi:cytochrome c oxidase assembly factor CtaG
VTSLRPPTWHPALVGVLAAVAVLYAVATRGVATRGERWRFAGCVAVLWLACAWPLGDLAAHVSLSAAIVQRLLVLLAAAPLLLTSLPLERLASWTRPRPIDATLHWLGHPAVAIAIVTVVGTATLLPAVIDFATGGPLQGAAILAVTLAVGVVLWLPILGRVPGGRHLSLVAKGAYCMAASLVVTSLSFVWIFSQHVLYPSFAHQPAVLGISAVDDQQLAGYVSKLGAYLPLWIVAFVLFARAGDGGSDEADPLRWVDVERELERADRRGPPTAEPS